MKQTVCAALLFVTALVACTPARAGEPSYADIVSNAFEQVDWNPGRTWAYTQTGFEDETLIVSRFDPSEAEGERWALLSVDNRPPSLEEIEAFIDEKQFEQALPDNDSDVPDMVELRSLELLREDDERWTFSFRPMLDGDEADFADRMAGELGVSKSTGALEYVEIANRKSIRPAVGVKLKTLKMRFDFAPASESGPQVVSEITAIVRGGAYLLISLDERETTRFSDFVYVGDAEDRQPAAAPR